MYDTAVAMAKRLLVDSIWKSANLEGFQTTFPTTAAILENAPTNTTRDEVLFIVNMKRAWQFLLDNLDARNDIMLLRQYNQIVGEMLFQYAGEIRTFDVRIGGTEWRPQMPNIEEIVDRINEINEIKNIELKALKFFGFVARTQMFIDGNKRVAQLIANKILIENNIGIFQIPISKLETFRELLVSFYETGDDTQITAFMGTNCIERVSK